MRLRWPWASCRHSSIFTENTFFCFDYKCNFLHPRGVNRYYVNVELWYCSAIYDNVFFTI